MTIGPEPMSRIFLMSLRRGISVVHYTCLRLILPWLSSREPGSMSASIFSTVPRVALDVPAEVGEAVDDALLDAARLFLVVDEQLEQRLARRLGILVAQEALDGGEAHALVDVLR